MRDPAGRPGKRRRGGAREGGNALIEMALVLLLLISLLGVVIDLGRALQSYVVVANAAREGARYASRYPFAVSEIRQRVREEAAGSGVALEEDAIEIDPVDAPPGQPIRVTVTYQLPTLFGGILNRETLTLRASVSMVVFGLDP